MSIKLFHLESGVWVNPTVSLDTSKKIICAAVDSLSPFAIFQQTDFTPPVISGMPLPDCTLWPPNGNLVQVATVTATDADSGVLPGSFQVTGASNEPDNDRKNPQIVIQTNRSGGYTVQLQADRLGTGTGRIYTLTATATDLVGNTANVTATCMCPTIKGRNARTANDIFDPAGLSPGHPIVLIPEEIRALVDNLSIRERTLTLLAVSTGLRQSELFGLKWGDIDFAQGTMNVARSIVYGVVGPCKTESSQSQYPFIPSSPTPFCSGGNSVLL